MKNLLFKLCFNILAIISANAMLPQLIEDLVEKYEHTRFAKVIDTFKDVHFPYGLKKEYKEVEETELLKLIQNLITSFDAHSVLAFTHKQLSPAQLMLTACETSNIDEIPLTEANIDQANADIINSESMQIVTHDIEIDEPSEEELLEQIIYYNLELLNKKSGSKTNIQAFKEAIENNKYSAARRQIGILLEEPDDIFQAHLAKHLKKIYKDTLIYKSLQRYSSQNLKFTGLKIFFNIQEYINSKQEEAELVNIAKQEENILLSNLADKIERDRPLVFNKFNKLLKRQFARYNLTKPIRYNFINFWKDELKYINIAYDCMYLLAMVLDAEYEAYIKDFEKLNNDPNSWQKGVKNIQNFIEEYSENVTQESIKEFAAKRRDISAILSIIALKPSNELEALVLSMVQLSNAAQNPNFPFVQPINLKSVFINGLYVLTAVLLLEHLYVMWNAYNP